MMKADRKILLPEEDVIIEELTNYSKTIGKKVYVVGGVVRDFLFGVIKEGLRDIDIAGTLTIEEITNFLKTKNIDVVIKSKKLSVVSFVYQSSQYEYARLRTEKYLPSDSHTPSIVEFVDEVPEDAKRRDFTVNAVYYDRHSNSLIDPFNGVDDINNKIIKPVLGEESFKVDPSRIIRFIELVSRFNLKVENRTMEWVLKYAMNLHNITKNRLIKEISRLLETNKYGGENGYIERVQELLKKTSLQEILKIDNSSINIKK